jgi:hypothetical protein
MYFDHIELAPSFCISEYYLYISDWHLRARYSNNVDTRLATTKKLKQKIVVIMTLVVVVDSLSYCDHLIGLENGVA